MKEFIEIPLAYRLSGIFVVGVFLGYVANLLAYALSMRPGRSPWSHDHPYDGKSRWLDRLPLVGWFRLSRKSQQLGRGFWLRGLMAELCMGFFCAALYYWEVALGHLLPPGPVAVDGDLLPSAITWEIMHAVFLSHIVLAFFMLAATLIDFDERIIPDEITVPGTLIGLMLAAGYAWTMMPVGVHVKPPGIQFVEFLTLMFPGRIYPEQWPAYLDAPKQTLPLIVAVAVYLFWCLSLLPWLWLPRRGFEKAVRMFIGHAMRSPSFPTILTIAICGSAGIGMVWWLGGPGWAALLTALSGLAVGAALIWGVRVIFTAILGKEAMGFGDVTLLAMIGTYLGWHAPIFIFFVAPFIGVVFWIVHLAMGSGRELPYGPYLCGATLIVIAGWTWFWERFIEVFGPVFPDVPIPFVLVVLIAFAVLGCILAVPMQIYRSHQHRKSQVA